MSGIVARLGLDLIWSILGRAAAAQYRSPHFQFFVYIKMADLQFLHTLNAFSLLLSFGGVAFLYSAASGTLPGSPGALLGLPGGSGGSLRVPGRSGRVPGGHFGVILG